MFVKKKFKIEKMFSVLAYTSIVAVMMLESAHAQDSASRDVLERYGNLNAVSYTHLRAHETREDRGWGRGG